MARPKPTVLMEAIDNETYKAEQILEADGVYAVFYQDKPINIKTINKLYSAPPKYKKTGFQNPGYALCLAKRLNDLFKTDEFEVRIMHGGEVYTGKPADDFYGE